jgi:pimeloyl-ACP methyl ester carboxylesterase
MTEHFFESRGLYYRVNEFTADRPTLVFIHGLSGSSSAWEMYEKYFEKNYNVLTYDLRGHGKSYKSRAYAAYAMDNHVQDLAKLLQYLDIKNYVLICHSYAVLIGLEFLATRPNGVAGVVFLSPGYVVGKRIPERILKPLFILSRIIELFPFSEKPGTHVNYAKFPNTGDWNLPRMIADVGNTSFHVYMYGTLQSYTVNKEAFLETLSMPVLLLQGKKDTIFPVTNSIFMHKKIKDSELVLIDHADHIVVLNNFKEVSFAIENFIDKKVNPVHP